MRPGRLPMFQRSQARHVLWHTHGAAAEMLPVAAWLQEGRQKTGRHTEPVRRSSKGPCDRQKPLQSNSHQAPHKIPHPVPLPDTETRPQPETLFHPTTYAAATGFLWVCEPAVYHRRCPQHELHPERAISSDPGYRPQPRSIHCP